MENTPGPLKHLPFWEHLEELRGRIIRSIAALVIASCFFYQYVDDLIPFLLHPIGRLVFTYPGEAMVAYFTLTLLGGVLIASPYLIYEIWAFASEGLKPNERRAILLYGPCSLVFFLAGVFFALEFILPITIKLFLSYSSDFIVPMISISQYVSFVGTLCLAFGLVFELPLLILFLTKIGIVTPEFLGQKRRHAIVAIFIVSAILTPPDYVSQFLMAVPMMGLYELGVIFSKMVYRPKKLIGNSPPHQSGAIDSLP